MKISLAQAEKLAVVVAKASGYIKEQMGICNNATYLVMMDAFDRVKQLPEYRHATKRAFREAVNEWQRYEHQLRYAEGIRFFHMGDMDADLRRKYGDITDGEYFEFWQGTGSFCYNESHDLLCCLKNKYRLSLENHKARNADVVAEVMTAFACMKLCEKIHRGCIEGVMKSIPPKVAHLAFAQFSIHKV